MKKFMKYTPVPILFLFVVSCVDKDIVNISDSVEINSSYSVPIGTYKTDINEYLEQLDTLGPSSGDSLIYEEILYPVNQSYVDISFSDSLNFNIVKDPSAQVKSIEFVIIVINGYPTAAVLQLYFMSGPGIIDSAFISGPRTITPAELNSEGIVTSPSINLITVSMPAEFIENLSDITGVLVKGRLYLTKLGCPPVKFQNPYSINLHIGARIELLYNINDI